ncbi:putative ArCR [uncultured archaeon]|nr:putative ArCR [uncultured archaeon]
MLRHIPALMDKGKPVSVLFTEEDGESSDLMYCELIQEARFGKSFLVRNQGCKVGAYVLKEIELSPEDYYYTTGRYRDRNAARRAVTNLSRLKKKPKSIKITPYQGEDFDILILFPKPEQAMRLVQAYTYLEGRRVDIKAGGIASVCSECTAYPMQGSMAISPGCKGSRKHSKYSGEELLIGIPFPLSEEIDSALGKIPGTLA